MESFGDDVNSVFHEDQKFFKSDTFESDTIFVTFKSVTFGQYVMICKKILKISKVTLLKTTKVLYL